ncbi:hypothetical protein BACCELL_02475 [Bacteroides cellulosilyticus DSM 14838]|uniref:Uncharacterized protein n=1 Tax=Bacteroides cellulosilyticus DSM 14838 TaxID=537012 RepID=E2NDW5_9BACE|nr:hypothetical protein BACCELL_02475 [Bacteroides cellulosilyticus DSM 14838]
MAPATEFARKSRKKQLFPPYNMWRIYSFLAKMTFFATQFVKNENSLHP